MARLLPPNQLKHELPPPPFPLEARWSAEQILQGHDRRLAVLVGPCSVHDPHSVIEYGMRLKALAREVSETLFLVMRVFIEKPRTRAGWKGILYDPHLDASNDIGAGLLLARKLFVELAHLGIPTATELLDPLASFYFDDLIAWGVIGARTSASQSHRQMASRLTFPVGFKNDFFGSLEPAIFGALSAKRPHSHLGLDPFGHISAIHSNGNPLTHIILRGSDKEPNFDPASVAYALERVVEHHLEPRLMIDCSHGNSGKILERQKEAFLSVVEQAASYQSGSIIGVMLESHLFAGRQPLPDDPSLLAYGVSITDPCLSWEETEKLLRWAHEQLQVTVS